MSAFLRNPPSAANLLESMRDIGYSLETALADLIDNSISADASTVEIFCIVAAEPPYVAIIDDGHGMDERELFLAMQHGGVSTSATRTKKDLGRFGLGLKTASFSQCRSLTVISKKKDGDPVGLCWDLDVVAEKNDWLLRKLSDKEISEIPHISNIGEQGTIVLWHKLDRLFEGEEGSKRSGVVDSKLETVRRHLSLVFHRFLHSELRSLGFNKLEIKLNGYRIEGFDPFCTNNMATQTLPTQVVHVGNSRVAMTPYILPHHSRLTAAEYDYYQDRSDFLSNQGAYVYRNGRLMAWGDWFRLAPKGEATKLARVQIDFSNDLDEAWTIDIKKSRAQPPRQVRDGLRQIIEEVSKTSVRVHKGRGKKYFQETAAPFWERYADRELGISYKINKEHPMITSLIKNLDSNSQTAMMLLFESIDSSLPIEMIYSDYSTNPRSIQLFQKENETELRKKILALKQYFFCDPKTSSSELLSIITSMPQYKDSYETIKNIIDSIEIETLGT